MAKVRFIASVASGDPDDITDDYVAGEEYRVVPDKEDATGKTDTINVSRADEFWAKGYLEFVDGGPSREFTEQERSALLGNVQAISFGDAKLDTPVTRKED